MTDEEAKMEWLELGRRMRAWKRHGCLPWRDKPTPYQRAVVDRSDDLLAFHLGQMPDIMSREEWEKTCPPRDYPED